jgi:endo-1,4-beta-xylanase
MKFFAQLSLLLAALPAFTLALPAIPNSAHHHTSAYPINLTKRNPGNIDYSQNYNGDVADYQYDLSTGEYSCSWNGDTDFVVGLGWGTGAAR